MNLEQFKTQIKHDTILAMKAKDKLKVGTLRSISNAITNTEIANRDKDINYIDILSTLAKQRKQSIEAYTQGGNTELAELETFELSVIEEYMPKSMTNDELKTALDVIITDMGGTITQKDMGRVIGVFRQKHPGQDMGTVSQMIKELIA